MVNRRELLKYSAMLSATPPNDLAGQHRWTRREGNTPKYLILACDGGGMRGYLSSLLLQRLNTEFSIFSNNNRNIDLYAGTSTGGLIALGLAQGKSIDSIVTLYKNSGPDIFYPLPVQPACAIEAGELEDPEIPHRSQNASSSDAKELLQVLFNNTGKPSLLTTLRDFIPGNPLLSSLASKVLVTTFQLADPNTEPASWSPIIIDNFEDSLGADTRSYDAALSSSAAPVYFPPHHHPKFGWCSDGGLFANNPAAVALGLAIQKGHALRDIALLSIGTGLTPSSLSPNSLDRLCFGLDRWVSFESRGSAPPFPLLNAIMDGVSANADAMCRQFLGANPVNSGYVRLNPLLPRPVALDDYSPETLALFEQTAEAYFQSPDWLTVGQWITANFVK